MNFHAYIINLKHAEKRWEHMRSQLDALNIPYTRIEGVYGDQLTDPVDGYNERRYQILTGKTTNKREIGCYFSHMKALTCFLESDLQYALILEDDIQLPPRITTLLSESIEYAGKWDMLRLTSSREGEYLPFAKLSGEYELACNLKVLKNTGAYFVNRHAAQCCVNKMLPMCLPYDRALDREWTLGFRTVCMIPFPIQLDEEFPSQIPKAKRIRIYRIITNPLFRIKDALERHIHRTRYCRNTRKFQPQKNIRKFFAESFTAE